MPVFILILVLAAAVAIFFVVRSRRLKNELAQLSPEDQGRHQEVLAADRSVKELQKAYDSAVRRAEQNRNAAATPRTLFSFGAVTITETSVFVKGSPHPLVPGISAHVDETGDIQKYATSRSTATRVVAGALLAGPVGAVVGGVAKKNNVHTNDTRQLFLVLTGPDWQEVIQLQPEQAAQARQFAAALFNAAQHASQHLQQYQGRLAQAESSYRTILSDTGGLDAAVQARAALGQDPLEELRKERALTKGKHANPRSLPRA